MAKFSLMMSLLILIFSLLIARSVKQEIAQYTKELKDYTLIENKKVCKSAVENTCFYGTCDISLEEMVDKACRFVDQEEPEHYEEEQ